MFYNTSYNFLLSAISFLRISTLDFLIHEAFNALLGSLFELLKVYLYLSYLAVGRQLLIKFVSVDLHYLFYVRLLQTVGKSIVEIRIYKSNEFFVLQHDKRLGYIRHVVQFALNLFRIDVLPAGSEKHVFTTTAYGDISLGIHYAKVTGMQPTVDVDNL